jgi:hypothetical protein
MYFGVFTMVPVTSVGSGSAKALASSLWTKANKIIFIKFYL